MREPDAKPEQVTIELMGTGPHTFHAHPIRRKGASKTAVQKAVLEMDRLVAQCNETRKMLYDTEFTDLIGAIQWLSKQVIEARNRGTMIYDEKEKQD